MPSARLHTIARANNPAGTNAELHPLIEADLTFEEVLTYKKEA